MFKRLGFGLLLAGTLSIGGVAIAAGLWFGLPIIGGASYCASSVNATCVSTVPAGPALTGAELIPADTKANGGASVPQTAYLSLASIGAGPYQYSAPATGATVAVVAATRQLLLEPAGTIATLTVTLPVATGLFDGQRLGICTTQIVTALTVTAGSGTTVLNAPTALLVPVATGAGSCVEWLYRVANTSWYRVQ